MMKSLHIFFKKPDYIFWRCQFGKRNLSLLNKGPLDFRYVFFSLIKKSHVLLQKKDEKKKLKKE